MNKKMKELLAQIAVKQEEARKCLEGETKDVSKATKLLDEVDALKAEYSAEKRLYDAEKAEAGKKFDEQKKEESPSEHNFGKLVKALIRKDGEVAATVTAMSEGVNADGGYTVPEDISTKINQYKTAEFSFEPYITTENVKTDKGSRTYETKAAITGFATVTESGQIPAAGMPHFETKTFAIEDKGGYIPITNDLLNDSDANIEAFVVNYLGRKKIATINSEVLAVATYGTSTKLTDLKGFKQLINVTIGSAFNSKIFTNDDGWNWLDCLEDENGRPLLTPAGDINNRIATLSIGGSVVTVVRVPNNVWASSNTHIPFVVGDLEAGITRYDRQQLSIKISDVAAVEGFNAFERNSALIRAIMRDQTKAIDTAAFKYVEVAFPAG